MQLSPLILHRFVVLLDQHFHQALLKKNDLKSNDWTIALLHFEMNVDIDSTSSHAYDAPEGAVFHQEE